MAAPQASIKPLTGGTLVLGTIVLSLATFMNVLDTSIANVSIPAIAGDLGVSPTQGTWVITSFAVANAISVPLTGWLTQRFGQVRLFVSSILLFTLASALCGMASSIEMLILFRILQGVVAGPMIPLSQTLLLSSYPKAKAGMALGMWAITTLVAPVCGPLLGGWITDNMSWPWIFYINIPVGLLAAGITWAIYRHRETPTRRLPIDTIGLALLVIWVGSMQVMLDLGKELDWFASSQIVMLALVAVVGFIAFVIWELTEEHPVVDLRLFAGRNFWVGTVAISLGYGAFFGSIVVLPLWLQQWMGYTATWAGMVTAPVGILAIVATPFVGANIARLDARKVVTVSFLVFALSMWMRSQFSTDTTPQTILIPIVIQGLALATFFIPLVTITLSGLPPEKLPAASGLSNFVRITAGAVGTSVSTTAWEHRAALHHAQLTEHLSGSNQVLTETLGQMSAKGLSDVQSLSLIDRLVSQQAFTMSIDDIFLATAVLFILMIPLVWLSHRIRRSDDEDGADDGAAASAAH
ncbi:DHA2 family efflux MFS transporter permease subunit [Granulosicoccus antarcticus]|uniref:Multidrug export protein EmrB n=1 Tax=Granulosicoccus antarcticus IMCC3135 TaxID=1192854 RepID=A0A2Z2P0L7_9GAMM|nr:DHA2 family efflux MFS transporter permease subunit [Granulosicoccus antarcticus]ASJ74710.1 Multidrug export protein EmrB [Granulosicoccus antarcticus IMCC3135]